jgi:hypothetical protein
VWCWSKAQYASSWVVAGKESSLLQSSVPGKCSFRKHAAQLLADQRSLGDRPVCSKVCALPRRAAIWRDGRGVFQKIGQCSCAFSYQAAEALDAIRTHMVQHVLRAVRVFTGAPALLIQPAGRARHCAVSTRKGGKCLVRVLCLVVATSCRCWRGIVL